MNQETALPLVPVLTDEAFFALLADAETVFTLAHEVTFQSGTEGVAN